MVGSRRVGKTALAHWAVNTGARTTYDATTTTENGPPKFILQLEHPEFGRCLLDIEDTPGYKPDPRNESELPVPPKELLEPAVAYMFCDDGVRKPAGEKPPEETEEEDDEKPGEKTKLVVPLDSKSCLDVKQDRQGFLVVYSEIDKDSFEEAKKLLTDIQTRMSKPVGDEDESEEQSEPDPDEEPPEIPPLPVVLVATHADAKKVDKKRKADKCVSKDDGLNLAEEFGIPFFETNSQRGGKHVKDAFLALVSAIQKVEDNLIWDKGPSCCERFCDRCCCSWCKGILTCCAKCKPRSCCSCCEGPITCCGYVCCVNGCSIM